ncbi:hypothetical protein RN001_005119 [Aquatica leii]|uniref:Uncharacterized protein n=1 Tax=Aquatica leii TaxID=1421715 RepID=A0AAN7P664_9COLE|nr:hypothetical protein RN001_005119 [Aquatica leii]
MQRATRNLSRDKCVEIVILSNESLTNRELNRRYRVSHTTVSMVLERFLETHHHARRASQGRLRATNTVENRFL